MAERTTAMGKCDWEGSAHIIVHVLDSVCIFISFYLEIALYHRKINQETFICKEGQEMRRNGPQ
jgi:hypothetical protein